MTRRLVAAVASCLALLAGLWLILAPFALGVQPENADWKDETLTDVWSGIGLGTLGLIGLIVFSGALAQYLRGQAPPALRAARTMPAAAETQAASEAPAAPPSSDLDKLLSPLISALTDDLARDRETPPARNPDPAHNGASAPQPVQRPETQSPRTQSPSTQEIPR